jgi:hypothetical protein
MINRAFIGLYNIKSSIRKSASDVNNNKKVDVADALVINRRFIGLINKYSISDWLFEDADFSIAGSDVSLDIKGICAGDVTGSY